MKLGFLKEMNPFRRWREDEEPEEYYALDNYSLTEYLIHFTTEYQGDKSRREKLVKKVSV